MMQDAALQPVPLYPLDANGHPINTGYKVIADHLAENINLKWSEPDGLVALFTSESKYKLGLVRNGNYWTFSHPSIIEANGWNPETVPIRIRPRDIANFPWKGLISVVDKENFGPN